MELGDKMLLTPGAKGIFVRDNEIHQHFIVSTVTGPAPSVGLVRQYLHDGKDEGHAFYVLYGASYVDELTYCAEIVRLLEEPPDVVKFVPTISMSAEIRNSGWKGLTGRVNTIAEDSLTKFNLSKNDTRVYACGHPGMIEDKKRELPPRVWNFSKSVFGKYSR